MTAVTTPTAPLTVLEEETRAIERDSSSRTELVTGADA